MTSGPAPNTFLHAVAAESPLPWGTSARTRRQPPPTFSQSPSPDGLPQVDHESTVQLWRRTSAAANSWSLALPQSSLLQLGHPLFPRSFTVNSPGWGGGGTTTACGIGPQYTCHRGPSVMLHNASHTPKATCWPFS